MPVLIRKALPQWAAIMTMRASVMVCKFGLAIFIGHYLDLASLGLYGLVAGAVAVGPAVVSLGMVHLLMREAVTLPPEELTDGLRHYWCFTAAVYALAGPVAVIAALLVGSSPLWAVVVAITLFEHLGNDVFQLFSNLQRPLLANASAFLRGAAWVLIYVPLALWNTGLRSLPVVFAFWLAGSMLAFALFVAASWQWPWSTAFSRPFRRRWLTANVRKAFVIYVSDLSFIASQYIDRYLVTLFLGLRLAGVYVLYWTVANAMSTFVSMVVLQQQRPLLIKAQHDGGASAHMRLTGHFMRTTAMTTALLGLAIGCSFQLVAPWLGQPAVAGHLAAFWLIMAGMALRSIADFGAMALFAARRDRLMTCTNVIAIAALVVAQVALLPRAGLYGAGAAIAITFGGITLWRYRLLFAPASARAPAASP